MKTPKIHQQMLTRLVQKPELLSIYTRTLPAFTTPAQRRAEQPSIWMGAGVDAGKKNIPLKSPLPFYKNPPSFLIQSFLSKKMALLHPPEAEPRAAFLGKTQFQFCGHNGMLIWIRHR